MEVPELPSVLHKYLGRLAFPGGVDGCWVWTGATTGHEATATKRARAFYGCVQINKKSVKAHRLFYEKIVGPIPTGLTIDHLCETKLCVNPKHLEPVTSVENVLRWFHKRRTTPCGQKRSLFCLRGHRRTVQTVKIIRHGVIKCRICLREKRRRRVHGQRVQQTVCIRGHAYEGNRVIYEGGTYCRICNRAAARRYKQRNMGLLK